MRPKKTLTLADGSTITVVAPGPAAHLTAMGVLPTAALLAAARGDRDAAEKLALAPGGIDAETLAMNHVRFVCACTRDPMLSATYPAPPGRVYYDDLDPDDWNEVERTVVEFKEASAEAVDPTSASAAATGS